ncbi:MAG: hypothetical protein IH861_09035 [Chloroflexi bacterium]|nr:hypothetical protein [Chloroflexota bacterium]
MQQLNPPVGVKVTPDLLRRLFDELLIFDKVHEGLFTTRLFWQSKSTPTHLDAGSSSQIHEYITSRGNVFARVHQYIDPNNRPIGRADPKNLRIDDVSLFV